MDRSLQSHRIEVVYDHDDDPDSGSNANANMFTIARGESIICW